MFEAIVCYYLYSYSFYMPENKANYLRSSFRTFLFAIRPIRGRYIAMWVLIIISNTIGGFLPYAFKLIADRVTQHSGPVSFDYLTMPFLFVSATLIIPEIGFRIGHYIENRASTQAFGNITTSLFNSIVNRPISYFENRFSGELGRRIEQVGTVVLYFVDSFPWEVGWIAITFIMSGVVLAFTHAYIFWTFIIWSIFFIATSIPLLKWHNKRAEKVATAQAQLSGSIIDSLSNITLIHSFGGARYEQDLNNETVNDVMMKDRKVRFASLVNKFHQGWNIVILGIVLTFVSVLLFSRGEFSVGDFVVVVATIPSLIGVIWSAGDIVIRLSKYIGEFSDAVRYLREQQEHLVGGSVDTLQSKAYPVVFEKVTFTYPAVTEPVFKEFSFAVEHGEHVGLVGSSGTGKSTLVKLLLRQYEYTSGEVRIGDVLIQDYTLDRFNQLISYVPQDTTLFHRSLLDNIQYANPAATKDEVIEASRQAHAHEFIMTLPAGYDTKVGERGVKLSGGQRQRIALARAILKNAPILVLDEATSSLDTESEAVIQDALYQLFQNRTVIAIAHRLSTLRAMDRIVVLEEGRIVESGNPQDLLKQETSAFKKMWEQQKNGFI